MCTFKFTRFHPLLLLLLILLPLFLLLLAPLLLNLFSWFHTLSYLFGFPLYYIRISVIIHLVSFAFPLTSDVILFKLFQKSSISSFRPRSLKLENREVQPERIMFELLPKIQCQSIPSMVLRSGKLWPSAWPPAVSGSPEKEDPENISYGKEKLYPRRGNSRQPPFRRFDVCAPHRGRALYKLVHEFAS